MRIKVPFNICLYILWHGNIYIAESYPTISNRFLRYLYRRPNIRTHCSPKPISPWTQHDGLVLPGPGLLSGGFCDYNDHYLLFIYTQGLTFPYIIPHGACDKSCYLAYANTPIPKG